MTDMPICVLVGVIAFITGIGIGINEARLGIANDCNAAEHFRVDKAAYICKRIKP